MPNPFRYRWKDEGALGTPALQPQTEKISKDMYAHEFISNLKSGYETEVGELGSRLSGGQRQRVAIAQAMFVEDTISILLLDEATSALDTKSEVAVQKALEAAQQQRTTIVVAHRLSTIRNADRIVVLDKGCVVEEGTFDSLIARDGAFAKFHKNLK